MMKLLQPVTILKNFSGSKIEMHQRKESRSQPNECSNLLNIDNKLIQPKYPFQRDINKQPLFLLYLPHKSKKIPSSTQVPKLSQITSSAHPEDIEGNENLFTES
jgi:hypothetical protein